MIKNSRKFYGINLSIIQIMGKKVSEYYDVTYPGYSIGWSAEHIHYGFWDEQTKSHEESLVNTVKYVADYLEVENTDIILDAGCGVGGASRYIAKNFGSKVIGLMNSEVMLENALQYKSEFDLPELIDFHLMDYHKTDFDDSSFSKVFGLESICYSDKKSEFAKEMFRLLKPGGKIVIADGFRLRDNLNDKEEIIYQNWLNGWMLPHLIMPQTFVRILNDNGYQEVKYLDTTNKIVNSSIRMYNRTRFTRLFHYVTMKLGISNPINYYSTRSAYLQKFLVDDDILGYGILIATKPE